jgi:hypothetical protein
MISTSYRAHEIKLAVINARRFPIKMSNEKSTEMPCEAEWAETAIDTDAVVPSHETAVTSHDADEVEMLDDGDTVEIVSDDVEDIKLLCGCEYCEGAVLQFYPDYVLFIKRLSVSEVNSKTMSQHSTTQWGCHVIQGFIDALWSTDRTVTADGDHILDVWNVAND